MKLLFRKRWKTIEKRIADLEAQVQSQQAAIKHHLECHESENEEFKEAIIGVKNLLNANFVK